MTRWFMLRQSTTYDWRSKRTGAYYQFVGDKIVAVNDARDQERFLQRPEHFIEVDERGNIIDQKTGQTISRSAFSRQGMVKEPRSYAKIAKTPTVPPKPEPPKAEPAPRKVVSSNKAEEAPPAPEPETKTPEPPAQDEVKEDVTQEDAGADDAAETSDDASKDSAPKKRRKKSSTKKKSGRTDDE